MKTRTVAVSTALFLAIAAGCDRPQTSKPAGVAAGLDRTVLPIAEPN